MTVLNVCVDSQGDYTFTVLTAITKHLLQRMDE